MPRIYFNITREHDGINQFYLAKTDKNRHQQRLKTLDRNAVTKILIETKGCTKYKTYPYDGWFFLDDPTGTLDDIEIEFKETYRNVGRPRKMKRGGVVASTASATNETHDGTNGGKLKGKTHANGGIDAIITDKNKPVELETDEVIINKETVNSKEIYSFEGKELKPVEILSILNVDGGGVPIMNKDGKVGNDTLKGGAGDNITIKDISEKYNVTHNYVKRQLRIGTEQELEEHTNNPEKAREIATDHIWKYGIDYYPNLAIMEKKLEQKKYASGGKIEDMALNKNQEQITVEIRKLINKNGLNYAKYTPAELQYLRKYEGLGGMATSGYVKTLGIGEKTNILDQFYTPDIVIKYMWALAVKFGFDFSKANHILEPSVGTGRFLEYIPNNQKVDAFDIDYYSYVITKLSFPEFNITHASMESLFFQGKRHVGLMNTPKRYDLVIGNPPYREYASEYSKVKGTEGTEKTITLAHTFDQYMIARGVDLLKPGGLLVFIIPNTFLSNNAKYNDFKNQLNEKAELLTAYRLPNDTFENTAIGTDIIVLKRK